MYQVGDKVVYGVHGICRIAEQEQRFLDGKTVTYLVLTPVGQEGTRFLVPTHNAAAMAKLRPVLTTGEAEGILSMTALQKSPWIQDEGRRKQTYRELITSGDCGRLLAMVQMICAHRAVQKTSGRKIHQCDENFLRDAERLLTDEIAIVLDIAPDAVRQTFRENIANTI